MKWFLAFYINDLPEGAGFRLYGPGHLSFLLIIALGAAAVCLAYKRAKPENQPRFCRVVAGSCFALELGKQILMLVTLPAYPITQLPLHLCGLGIFVQTADAFIPRLNKTTREILFSLSMPGAAAALIFPDWPEYPILNFYSSQSFVIHGLLLCYPLMLLAGRQLRPDWRNLWRPAFFLSLVSIPMHFVNKRLGTNFLFISESSPASPLELLETRIGSRGYLFGYAALILLVWLVMYAPFIVRDLRNKIFQRGNRYS